MVLKKDSLSILEELPIRLAHRVKELDELPQNLSQMPSIVKVKNWYAESFQDLIELPTPQISNAMREKLISKAPEHLPHSVPNPSLAKMIKPHNPLKASVPISQR
jgi:pyruvate dehydrogenase kinase 2/3/4